MTNDHLQGRVAVVTGSARNIGRAIALELARQGAAVVVHARGARADAEAVAAEITGAGGRAVVQLGDVSKPAEAAAIVAAATAAFGRLDILVNNASVRREVDFADLDYEAWREITGITLDGAYLCSRAALAPLSQSGAGAIVNIGGLSAHTGATRRAHVVAAKAGLVGLTRALAHDLGPKGITVNCVAPGLIQTVRSGKAPAHHAVHNTLTGQHGTPKDIAELVAFLCGPSGRYITGQTIHANGGAYLP
jgi:3-oxoacyl-[acyl-carrier protein] reductase